MEIVINLFVSYFKCGTSRTALLTMPERRCAVKNCQSDAITAREKGECISFYKIPKEGSIRREWIKICRKHEGFDPEKKCICSRHFTVDDFEDGIKAKLTNTRPKRLKQYAIPKECKRLKKNTSDTTPITGIEYTEEDVNSCENNDLNTLQECSGAGKGFFNFKVIKLLVIIIVQKK